MTNLEALTKLEELLLKSKQPIPNAGTTEDQPLPVAQSNSALLFHFASQTHATVKALLDAASTPAPKKSHKGFGMSYNGPINPNGAGSGTLPFVPGPQDPNDPLPSPVLPDSGSPDTSIPSDQESTYNLTGFLDKLPEFFQAIAKGDPVALQRLMGYIYNLTAAGLMNQDVMNQLDKADTMTGIMIAMTQGMEEAFFCGYQSGGGPVQNGIAGASQWIQDMLGKLNAIPGGQDNKYIEQMKGALEGLDG
ncbi:MAG TPA: hypothetical protein VLE89_03045, partial [Chlamydiales bacterium]|nr:hypothetical protein [Chlamydiales bacterium]